MALQQASAPVCGAPGRLGYLCAGGVKEMFVMVADHSMRWLLPGPRMGPH